MNIRPKIRKLAPLSPFPACFALAVLLASAPTPVPAQAPSGPITPQPGTPVQQAPLQPKIDVRVSLVNAPVTVRDSKGQMIHTLEARNFRVTDNGVPQQITSLRHGRRPALHRLPPRNQLPHRADAPANPQSWLPSSPKRSWVPTPKPP